MLPYWHAKFPNGAREFNEIPEVARDYDPLKVHEVSEEWFKKYGYVVKENVKSGVHVVHLFHFEDFKTVYGNDGAFPIRRSHEVIAKYREQRKHLYDHVGLGPGQGEEWHHLRKLTRKKGIFSSSKTKMDDCANDFIEKIRDNLNEEGEIDLLPWLHRWAFEGIGIAALNRRLNALSKENNEKADKMVEAAALTDYLVYLTTLDPETEFEERFKRVSEAQDFFDGVLRGYIEDIKRDIEFEPEEEGAVQILLQGGKCTENDAITLVLDMFQGALQTTPLVALLALYNLARNSEVQAAAREETMRRMPEKDSSFFEVEEPLNLLRCIVHETLRLNPPIIGNGRITQKDLVLGGYKVPANTSVILNFQVACRQEENYEEPLKFNPERDLKHKLIDYLFGGSVRKCPGSSFATRELFLILSKIIRNFEISYDGGEISFINQLQNRPDKPLILRLKPVEE